MAKAHTGHLTGSDAVISAVFRQFGVTRVDGLDELLDTAAAFARTKRPRGDGVGIYAISGGTGAHMADMAAAAGLRLPDLTKETQRALHDGLIPEYLRVSNPVDWPCFPMYERNVYHVTSRAVVIRIPYSHSLSGVLDGPAV